MLEPRLTSTLAVPMPGVAIDRGQLSRHRRRAAPRWGRAPVSDLRIRPCDQSSRRARAGSCCAARSRDGSCGGPRAPSARPPRPSPRLCGFISATSRRSLSISCFELHDPLHALEVEPCLGQRLDQLEPLQVGAGIAAGAPRSAVWLDEPTTLVDPQSLGVHPGQLGGHRDDEDRLAPLRPPEPCQTLRLARGFSGSKARSSSSSFLASLLTFWGTTTSTVARRSPGFPFRDRSPYPSPGTSFPPVYPGAP